MGLTPQLISGPGDGLVLRSAGQGLQEPRRRGGSVGGGHGLGLEGALQPGGRARVGVGASGRVGAQPLCEEEDAPAPGPEHEGPCWANSVVGPGWPGPGGARLERKVALRFWAVENDRPEMGAREARGGSSRLR